MLTALVFVVAILALLAQNVLNSKRVDRVSAQWQMRQDLLLNRLASRTLGEYTAASVAQQNTEIAVVQEPAPEAVRYLYDETGLNRIIAPADLEDAAYAEAGSL